MSGAKKCNASLITAAIAATLLLVCGIAPPQAFAASPAASTRIYFIAGFASALDDQQKLASLFAVDGVPIEAVPPSFWRLVVRQVAGAYRESGEALHVILVGHSMGAIRAYEVAAALDRRGIPVDLVIGFDPTREATVSPNVVRAVNFFLTPDVAPVVPAPGFHGQLVNEVVGDIAELPHHDIIYDAELHQRALSEITHALR